MCLACCHNLVPPIISHLSEDTIFLNVARIVLQPLSILCVVVRISMLMLCWEHINYLLSSTFSSFTQITAAFSFSSGIFILILSSEMVTILSRFYVISPTKYNPDPILKCLNKNQATFDWNVFIDKYWNQTFVKQETINK